MDDALRLCLLLRAQTPEPGEPDEGEQFEAYMRRYLPGSVT